MELTVGMAMIVALVVTIGVKYVTTVRGIRLREKLLDTESDLRATRGRFKAAENERGVAEREVKNLERQIKLVDKKVRLYTDEVKTLRK